MSDPLIAESPDDLIDLADLEEAVTRAQALVAALTKAVAADICRNGRADRALLEKHQTKAHGLAWYATYAETLKESLGWARTLEKAEQLSQTEKLILAIGCGEYLSQMASGIPMSQTEIVRPGSVGASPEDFQAFMTEPVMRLITTGNTEDNRRALAKQLEHGQFGQSGLDETLEMVRDSFRRFANDHKDAAHSWHLKDQLIPIEVISALADMGVFGLTIPEQYGGAGMGKAAMCVVSEELSRGYIGLGSLGTRSEIAAELILTGGTDAQKQYWLPKLASGEILPTAVFTEPNTGSDLGSLSTRAVKDGDLYRITGNKTWITHAARADLMTMLVRTDPDQPGYKLIHAVGGKAARHRCRSLPRQWHDRRRNRSSGLSRHERI